jgi:hypothetical protein
LAAHFREVSTPCRWLARPCESLDASVRKQWAHAARPAERLLAELVLSYRRYAPKMGSWPHGEASPRGLSSSAHGEEIVSSGEVEHGPAKIETGDDFLGSAFNAPDGSLV